MFRKLYKVDGWNNLKKETVVQKILKKSYDAHNTFNTLGDAELLQEVYTFSKATSADTLNFSF